jgi:Lon protease-like protein
MTRRLPLFPLSTVLFPEGPLALRIFERRYVDMVSRCMRDGTGFVVVLLLEGAEAGQPSVSTASIGTEARIVDFDRLEDGLLGLTCVGQGRVRIVSTWRESDGLNVAEVEDLPGEREAAVPKDCAHLALAVEHLYPNLPPIYPQWVPPRIEDARWVGNRLAELAPFEANVRQELLEMADPIDRLRYLSPLVQLRDSTESH